ncbi:MAG: aminoglycoside phosphotransferase family protein [Chloroflexi bacterium]|nr:aminoglycoside phosphotransferase family protein [Chloroflexota bacterium]
MRETGPWAASVHSFLRHLARVGFSAAPEVVGTGFADDGRETLGYIAGEVINPRPWASDAFVVLGKMLRELHDASSTFVQPADAVWPPFFGRALGGPHQIVSHCDFAPWNIVSQGGVPIGLIDWEYAGPIDPLVELAQAAWLNVRLFSDDIAEIEGLPSLRDRADQLGG